MQFSLFSWWQRKRIQATVRLSGRPMHFHRVTNPYHAVSIKAGQGCRRTAQKLRGQRFLAGEAPPLPQPTCNVSACTCRYVHHEDRREVDDRRLRDIWDPNSRLATGADRRVSHGRRATDH
jgi:hypothetical protein